MDYNVIDREIEIEAIISPSIKKRVKLFGL